MAMKVNLNIKLEAALRARLAYVGERMGLSTPDAARLALTQFVATWERENKPIPQRETDERVKAILEKNPSIQKKGR